MMSMYCIQKTSEKPDMKQIILFVGALYILHILTG